MKLTISLTLILMMMATGESLAFPADPGLGDTKVCRHIHEDGRIQQFGIVQANQDCPPFVEHVTSNGITYTITTTGDGIWVNPPMTDQSNPTCWNQEIVIPSN